MWLETPGQILDRHGPGGLEAVMVSNGWAARLPELLVESAPRFSDIAAGACAATDCAWYHGSWQFLRLMDIASSPHWHADFYRRWLADSTPRGDCLVSGTSDYTMAAFLVDAGSTRITVADRCRTPLLACEWLARRMPVAMETWHTDIRDLRTTGDFGLICSDSFISRADGDGRRELLNAWRRLLAPVGRIVTTVRIRRPVAGTEADQVEGFRAAALRRWAPFAEATGVSADLIGEMAAEYARHAVDYSLDTADGVLDAVGEIFEIVYWEVGEPTAGVWPGAYLRLVAGRN